jgi:hypothetical protein
MLPRAASPPTMRSRRFSPNTAVHEGRLDRGGGRLPIWIRFFPTPRSITRRRSHHLRNASPSFWQCYEKLPAPVRELAAVRPLRVGQQPTPSFRRRPESMKHLKRAQHLSMDPGLRRGDVPFSRHGRACPGHPRLLPCRVRKVVDARHKTGHDGGSYPRLRILPYDSPHLRSPGGALARRRRRGAGSGACSPARSRRPGRPGRTVGH